MYKYHCLNPISPVGMGQLDANYENTENALPHPMVKKFMDMNNNPKYAIDLGCGAGRDTIYLIKKRMESISNR